jgi:hypothetical protein
MLEYWKQGMGVEQAAARVAEWGAVATGYRQILGEAEGWRKARLEGRAAPAEAAAPVGNRGRGRLATGPLLTEAQMIGHRVRYFTDGLVLGTREFVERAFTLARNQFGPRRRTGSRRLARSQTDLRVMRALQENVYR